MKFLKNDLVLSETVALSLVAGCDQSEIAQATAERPERQPTFHEQLACSSASERHSKKRILRRRSDCNFPLQSKTGPLLRPDVEYGLFTWQRVVLPLYRR